MSRQFRYLAALLVVSAGAVELEKASPAITDRQDFQSPDRVQRTGWGYHVKTEGRNVVCVKFRSLVTAAAG